MSDISLTVTRVDPANRVVFVTMRYYVHWTNSADALLEQSPKPRRPTRAQRRLARTLAFRHNRKLALTVTP